MYSSLTFIANPLLQIRNYPDQYRRKSISPPLKSPDYVVTCSMKPFLEKLVQRKDLTSQESCEAVNYAVSGEASDAEIAAFLSLLAAKGETAAEIIGVVEALQNQMIPVHYDEPVLDIVGTGGDGANTVNISTAASIVAAAAGCRVAKHGNRSASSKSGSADVLEALGIELSLSPDGVARCIRDAGIGFMFAPNHHPSLKRIGHVRKAMKIRTVFNIVGPFLNPCFAKCAVIGVYKPELLNIAADVLIALGLQKGVVVHTEGLDEYSSTGVSKVVEINNGAKNTVSFDPEMELGLPRVSVADLRGGDANFNGSIIREVLKGEKKGPITDAIALNAAVGCWVYGLDPNIVEGLKRVRNVLNCGAAWHTLNKWAQVSQSASKVSC